MNGYSPMCKMPIMSQSKNIHAPRFINERDLAVALTLTSVNKELSTVTYRNCDTKGMVHNGFATYQTLWHLMFHKGQTPLEMNMCMYLSTEKKE